MDPKQYFTRFFAPDEIPNNIVESAERWEWEKATMFGIHLALKNAQRYIVINEVEEANRAMITFLGIKETKDLLDHISRIENEELPERLLVHSTITSIFNPIQAPANRIGRTGQPDRHHQKIHLTQQNH